MRTPPKPRNPVARALRATPLYRKQIVRARKGKGSYRRTKGVEQ